MKCLKKIDCSGIFFYNFWMKRNIFIFIILLFIISCKKRIKTIPEISVSLTKNDVVELSKENNIAKTIINNKSEIVFFTLEGKVFRYNPELKIINFLYNLNLPSVQLVISTGDIVAIKFWFVGV